MQTIQANYHPRGHNQEDDTKVVKKAKSIIYGNFSSFGNEGVICLKAEILKIDVQEAY